MSATGKTALGFLAVAAMFALGGLTGRETAPPCDCTAAQQSATAAALDACARERAWETSAAYLDVAARLDGCVLRRDLEVVPVKDAPR